MSYSIQEIASILNAEYSIFNDNRINILLTDSRSLTFPEESLFFEITSVKNNGHKYINHLYRKGVRNFVVSDRTLDYSVLKDANILCL